MANTIAGSAYFIDTSAAFPQITEIVAVKVMGGASGSVVIKAGSSSGPTLFSSDATTTQLTEDLEFRNTEGIYVTVSTSKVFIYTRIRK